MCGAARLFAPRGHFLVIGTPREPQARGHGGRDEYQEGQYTAAQGADHSAQQEQTGVGEYLLIATAHDSST